jgi:hypothetical protein
MQQSHAPCTYYVMIWALDMHMQVYACMWSHTLVAVKLFSDPNSGDPLLGPHSLGCVSSKTSSPEPNQIQTSLQRVRLCGLYPRGHWSTAADYKSFFLRTVLSHKLHARACVQPSSPPEEGPEGRALARLHSSKAMWSFQGSSRTLTLLAFQHAGAL